MQEKFKIIYEKIVDFIFIIIKKFDKVSEKIFEKTGVKINVGAIVVTAVAVIFIVIFVKSILGWLWSML